MPKHRLAVVFSLSIASFLAPGVRASYTNFESSHVHPIDLTPSGTRLLAVNTPDALLEVFTVLPDGGLSSEAAIPVGLEPVTVVARTDGEAWVVNNLSDTVSIVDLAAGTVTRTLTVGDEPVDVAFAGGKAFVAVSQEDRVKVYDLQNLDATPAVVPLFGRDLRALAVSGDGSKVYAVVLRSGNGTTVVGGNIAFGNSSGLDTARLNALGLRDMMCTPGGPPPYPPYPDGIERNPALTDPPPSNNPAQFPRVALIVRWDPVSSRWVDEDGSSWTHCLPYRPADQDLFVIDAATLAVTTVTRLGTSLFDVSVHPTNGKIYVPNTEARNFVRFEHPLGVEGHVVDNRLTVVDPGAGNTVTPIELNAHIDRGSDPATNLAEREASISQPGMFVWKSDGSAGYLTAIGSRRLFRVAAGCLTAECIFGANRSDPDAVVVGEGPTGVALLERSNPADERLYVLNRISHSLTVVQAQGLVKLEDLPLHDPSSTSTREGRRFLYDAIDTSGHGDSACSSCHLSGDHDGLAWDLGNPAGTLAPYSASSDNVRFVVPIGGQPFECPPSVCASHDGFDPQKGPMTTQTLRAMLEPLHWRGDRPTMNEFNPAFVGLLGKADIGPVNGAPAGLSAEDMAKFRSFTLSIQLPPNPFRAINDTTPCGPRNLDPTCEVSFPGGLFPGNPTEGALLFDNFGSDAGQPCRSCHTHPFGAGGGQLGGVTPTEPTSSAAAALFNGTLDGSPHSDLKIPHMRNLYDRFGPVWAAPGDNSRPPTKSTFGFVHDGSVPDLYRFLSAGVFTLSAANQAQQVRDLVAFSFLFPSGTRPAVGRQVTLPAAGGAGGSADEALLSSLISLGDGSLPGRHCELVATALSGGRVRSYQFLAGLWATDLASQAPLTTAALRQTGEGPITFTCTPLGSGARLGGDRDEDHVLNGDDCAAADVATWGAAQTVAGLALAGTPDTILSWNDQAAATGSSLRYDVLGGLLSDLPLGGFATTSCLAAGLSDPTWSDPQPDPPPGAAFYYLIRAGNPCGTASLGAGRESLETLDCGGL